MNLVVTLALTLQQVIYVRQKIHSIVEEIPQLPAGITLPDITRADAEKDFTGLLKYLLNFGFYKFGIEITCFMMVVSIGSRSDFMSIYLAIYLLVFTLCSRKTVSRIWAYFLISIAILMPLQYLLCLGFPPILCWKYYWENVNQALLDWLFLPYHFENAVRRPEASRIYCDFFVLLLASRQLFVFKTESHSKDYPGGSNSDQPDNSVVIEDFFTSGKNRYDHSRAAFFTAFCWLTLAIVFWTAMIPDNLLGVGYIIGCFVFLWSGSEFYLRPIRSIIFAWNMLIFYTIAVIAMKISLEVYSPRLVYFVFTHGLIYCR